MIINLKPNAESLLDVAKAHRKYHKVKIKREAAKHMFSATSNINYDIA